MGEGVKNNQKLTTWFMDDPEPKWKQQFPFILSRRSKKEKHEIDLFSMDHWHMSNESKLRRADFLLPRAMKSVN